MKVFLKNNSIILLAFLITIGISTGFLLSYEKTDIHYYLNQFVGNKYLNFFFTHITYIGDGTVAVFILIIIMLANIRLGIYATSSFLTATFVSIGLKHLFFDDVNRPSFIFQHYDGRSLTLINGVDLHIHNSFPSGHATQAFSILMCLAFTTQNKFYKLTLFGLAFLTAISRVYLSQHWLIDITVGSIIGMLFSCVYYFVFITNTKLVKLNHPLFSIKTS
ncbi:phosphatase PAP2 family protein [Aurantibacillus circumpalustris]|uniref:phosphatase PAP2 family protein n=1 Tax=Aurantibacillus circumpalustris TaxID=3036359 RepID=UPI00295C323C|nr:phosphatase PAP2 family protein [Aurantibacillus circumpalustris]